MKFHAYVFADGSSSAKDDVGAWAAVAISGEKRRLLYGIDFPTTISRCELRPIIEALRWIKTNWQCKQTGYRVKVYSDSEYTIKTLCGLYPRGKNTELWAAVDEAAKGLQVTYMWRERNSTPCMDLCDGLAGTLRRRTKALITEMLGGGDANPLEPELILKGFEPPEDE